MLVEEKGRKQTKKYGRHDSRARHNLSSFSLSRRSKVIQSRTGECMRFEEERQRSMDELHCIADSAGSCRNFTLFGHSVKGEREEYHQDAMLRLLLLRHPHRLVLPRLQRLSFCVVEIL